jgi:hypothetical protein
MPAEIMTTVRRLELPKGYAIEHYYFNLQTLQVL